MKPPISSEETELASNLSAVITRLVKVLRRHARNTEMLSLTERATLGLLYQHGRLLPTELAQMEKVTTQSMSQVIGNLHKMDFILKDPSQEDRRKIYLSLTPQGKSYVETLRQEKSAWLARTLHENISTQEKETLATAVGILAKLIEE
jgi:DNA-binding MarR family transcriptional regulator